MSGQEHDMGKVERATRQSRVRNVAVYVGSALALCLNACFAPPALAQAAGGPDMSGATARHADFNGRHASEDARSMADWVLTSNDNRDMPFVLVDKGKATVYVFGAAGRLQGAAPALLGLTVGDDTVPGIGTRKLSDIRTDERTTPAGRFLASIGHNVHGGEILWIDFDIALSMHPVITTNPKEHRAQRLATPTPLDNRISYGCINVPAAFFKQVVSMAFKSSSGIVYILPETRSLKSTFASFGEAGHVVQAPTSVPTN